MTGNIPKYMELVNWVKEKVEAKELKSGDKLYSENELSSMFSMSRQTVRHGISKLEQEGIVERIQGSGTYICNKFKYDNPKTLNIAVVTTYVDRYIFPNVIKEMEKVISGAGYFTQIAFTYNTLERESSILQTFLNNNIVDGIIVEPTKSGIPNPNIELYHEIIDRKIPTIFINSYYPNLDLPHVAMDDTKAGLIAVNHLIELGHTNIAGIFKADDRQGHFRYSGYVNGLLNAGLKIHDDNIVWIDTEDTNHMEDNEQRILKRLKGCTGCVCYNDEVAVSVVEICKKNNISIPEQLSIVSIDDSDMAARCDVPLTSVAYPITELGKKSAQNLLYLIEDDRFDANYDFTPTLTIRNSVKKL
ncbi:GntR family transcriptional regulator of arabinose operon [Mobilisporobacter senegalensis]|uniref:GntR family transcriptional regulator of arabinose operon n=1 Tax=Mobilisporobacter senegalensis TaxID=1329262 RepID=A0A3N1XZ19_9FIRM|nr:GntR family transcriptional regulator [Mobilisporobacter senegalensis]ROR30492.1 GntR family transcriptional regulator of arabinose operon [Mobilisporobacter senegalensis]